MINHVSAWWRLWLVDPWQNLPKNKVKKKGSNLVKGTTTQHTSRFHFNLSILLNKYVTKF